MDGVVKLVPVPKLDPPVKAAYQFKVPELAVAPNVTVPVPHREEDWLRLLTGNSYPLQP